ncbi:hypothetical protein Ddye_010903 [Dipteronia dyeriana]|uniref:RNase H type-1 domain-containing protein n=1 Tax=Dipteronia dyeriana TaxID=168575 RepID=A0AAE0CNQ2_9ROSI|nr:hypothetical protein Ddye_010903 [Dipteronia dyeriana]
MEVAEAKAIFKGLSMASNLGLFHVQVEYDAVGVVKLYKDWVTGQPIQLQELNARMRNNAQLLNAPNLIIVM